MDIFVLWSWICSVISPVSIPRCLSSRHKEWNSLLDDIHLYSHQDPACLPDPNLKRFLRFFNCYLQRVLVSYDYSLAGHWLKSYVLYLPALPHANKSHVGEGIRAFSTRVNCHHFSCQGNKTVAARHFISIYGSPWGTLLDEDPLIFNCRIHCDLYLIIVKLVYSYIETVSLEDTHLDPKPKQEFIWNVNDNNCELCSPYLGRHVNTSRIKTSFALSALNVEGEILTYIFFHLYSLSECECSCYHVWYACRQIK